MPPPGIRSSWQSMVVQERADAPFSPCFLTGIYGDVDAPAYLMSDPARTHARRAMLTSYLDRDPGRVIF